LEIPISRRTFMGSAAAAAITAPASGEVTAEASTSHKGTEPPGGFVDATIVVNGHEHRTHLDPRTTLLDYLRETLDLTGAKKGCNRGECGACTVHLEGRRVNSCLVLAASCHGRAVTTIEGLAQGDSLHPVQQAFLDCDGFQCGFCTPGQIMSAVACIAEGHAGTDDDIREWMSGNLCRCSAYPQIVEAVRTAAGRKS